MPAAELDPRFSEPEAELREQGVLVIGSPLFVSLGAATDPGAPTTTTIDGYAMGLSKRFLQAA